MRIISGSLKGRKLQTFHGTGVRPTPDRVREALFSILSSKTKGAAVLDLFAGTGALGIEAVSRGASSAFFIDNSPASLTILKKNLRHCRLSETAQVIRWDASRNLNCLRAYHRTFNLVFMDPPYGHNLATTTLKHLLQVDCLDNGATIVVEHEPGLQWVAVGSFIRMIDSRRYGRTQLSFFSFEVTPSAKITGSS